MKQGVKSIDQLYNELERQRKARNDIIAATRCLTVSTAPNGITTLAVQNTEENAYKVSEVAHHQLADRLSIPYKYYERLRYEYPQLLDKNIKYFFTVGDV